MSDYQDNDAGSAGSDNNDGEGEFDYEDSVSSEMEYYQEINPGEREGEGEDKEVLDINGEMVEKIELVKNPENYEEEGEKMDWDQIREARWRREIEAEAYDLDFNEEDELVEEVHEVGLLEIAKKNKLKEKAKKMEGDRRISGNVLTKYEYCQLVAMRSRQIAMGSSIYVTVPENRRYRITPLEVAELEFKEKRLPMRVKRVHPNGDYEFWGLEEMDFDFWNTEINLSLNNLQ